MDPLDSPDESVARSDEAEAFCRGIYPRLLGALSLSCHDAGVAEELTQETFARVWERWPAVRAHSAPEAWTFRVAFNLANSSWRRAVLARRTTQRLRNEEHAAPGPPDRDGALAVRAAVGALPRRQREAIVRRYFLDQSVEQCATAMGCAEGTVKALTSQAKAALRASDLLADDTNVDGDDG